MAFKTYIEETDPEKADQKAAQEVAQKVAMTRSPSRTSKKDIISSPETNLKVTPISAESLASLIDHTLLKQEATPSEIDQLCREARENRFFAVCVNSAYIRRAVENLKGSGVKAIAVVGFPLGASSSASKAFETRDAIKAGAEEIDMVIPLGALKSMNYSWIYSDILHVVEAARPYSVKVILETGQLNQEQITIGCALAQAAGAAFVKTSTGFAPKGATIEDIQLMRRIVGPDIGVKASGGIRTYEDALRMIAAGANRIGTSAGVAIMERARSEAEGQKNVSTQN